MAQVSLGVIPRVTLWLVNGPFRKFVKLQRFCHSGQIISSRRYRNYDMLKKLDVQRFNPNDFDGK